MSSPLKIVLFLVLGITTSIISCGKPKTSVVKGTSSQATGNTPGGNNPNTDGTPAEVIEELKDSIIIPDPQVKKFLAELNCKEGEIPKWRASDSKWVCGTITDSLNALECDRASQVVKWNGTKWGCQDDSEVLKTTNCTNGWVLKWNDANKT